SRQYSCESFVCFFCRQEKRRALGLRAVTVARLPVFLYAPRVSHTLVVDDGKQLTIGSCVECKSMVLAGQNMQQDGTLDRGRPAGTKQKSSTVEESAGSSKEDARQPTAPVREVSKHVHAPSGESGITFTRSHLSSEDRDR
ncbi:hypothetical protein PGIGA_G00229270, partial [Pangasianodon gigas]|nr:hypothetical protein [Pangasianodon gigas]